MLQSMHHQNSATTAILETQYNNVKECGKLHRKILVIEIIIVKVFTANSFI